MAVILDFLIQGAQVLLVLLLAPGLTGLVRKVKARLLRRQGPPLCTVASRELPATSADPTIFWGATSSGKDVVRAPSPLP